MITDFFKRIFNKTKPKKLGLALGSGGAKGMAHIGAIRAFDEEGISFDVVTGTSIGSIVGGMYAAGFSSAAMLKYVSELELLSVQTLIKMKFAGKTTEKLLDEIMGGATFEDLALPFAAVATDIYNGKEEVISSGNVAKAIRASSAIPPVFKPIVIDGKTLADGAYLNSVPADVAKSFGADVVIGINLSKELPTNEKIKPILDDMYNGNKVPYFDRSKAGKEFSDVLICPDLSEFSSASVSPEKLNKMLEIGYNATKEKMPEIKALLKRNKILR